MANFCSRVVHPTQKNVRPIQFIVSEALAFDAAVRARFAACTVRPLNVRRPHTNPTARVYHRSTSQMRYLAVKPRNITANMMTSPTTEPRGLVVTVSYLDVVVG